MRRLLLCVLTGGFFLGMLTGCGSLGLICHTNGICDCDNDDNPCTHRQPWVLQHTYPAYNVTTPVALPPAAPSSGL